MKSEPITPSICAEKKKIFANSKRLVIKVGSRLLLDPQGGVNENALKDLVREIALLQASGKEVILVSSGAISAGMARLGLKSRPDDIATLQACASIGQGVLMNLYESACRKHDCHAGQLLLSADDLRSPKRHLNLRNCLNALLEQGALPVINENDSVSIDEICFGDNDRLAALVSVMSNSDLCLLLTSENGLREQMNDGGLGGRIPLVKKLGKNIMKQALPQDGNAYSTGGMESKLEAVRILTRSGESAWIADGRDFNILSKISSGLDVGTLFQAEPKKMKNRNRFLAWFSSSRGTLLIDDGACNGLYEGGSLLSKGILSCQGDFHCGDTVEIRDRNNKLIARGIVNYAQGDLSKLCGRHSSEFSAILDGKAPYQEAVHRNNMSLINQDEKGE